MRYLSQIAEDLEREKAIEQKARENGLLETRGIITDMLHFNDAANVEVVGSENAYFTARLVNAGPTVRVESQPNGFVLITSYDGQKQWEVATVEAALRRLYLALRNDE